MRGNHLYVTAYRHMAIDDFGRLIAAPMTPPLAEMVVDITNTSQLSHPFPQYTTFVFIKPTIDCHLAFAGPGDQDPVADEFHYVNAGEGRFYGAQAGGRIAVREALN